MGGKGKRILKIFAWFILSFFLIIIGAGVFVYFKAQPWLIGELSSVVEEKSDGLYDLSLDAIGLKLVPFSIEISGISLQLNEEKSAEILKKLPEKTFYSFQSPEIKINAIALKTLIKNHRFDCKNISIVSPGFELHGEKILRQDSTQFLAPLFNELRPLFKKYLKSISVGEVNFIDADYGLYSSVSDTSHFANAEQVSIAIKKFSTDSAAVFSGTNLFRAGDVLIRMNQFKNDMGDSLHVLCIDSLEFSLKSSDIHASGFHLAPTRVDHSRNRFDVFVPHLYLKSKSATRLAINDSVHVQFLKFEQPRINFYQKENPKHIRIEDINNFNLYSLVKSQFQKIEIDSFFLSDASLNIFRQPDDSVFQQHFKTIDIVLNGFLLDSTSSHNPQKLFHADNLEMNVAGYQLRLDDNQHDFRADSMFVSTVTNSLGVSGITILPTNLGVRTSHTLANISCNRLKIGGVNLKTLYHTRLLPTKDIEITDPKVQLQYQTDIARSAEQKESGLLFQLVSAYLKGVYSEKVNIEGGILKIQNIKKKKVNGYFQTNFSFNLLKFALDSASIHQTDKFFYASEFDVLFSNYQMKLMDNLHKIDVDSISMSSAGRKVEIKNLHLQPVIRRASAKIMQRFNRSELYHIFVPKIEMKGMNLTDAFFYNKLDINDFKISSPKIYFENFGVLRRKKGSEKFSEFYQLLFNYIYDFNIRRITIPDGTFSWINHTRKGKTTSFDNEFSATLNNFRLNENEIGKKRLLFSDDFDITVKDQIFQLSDSVHILRAGDIHLSTNQSKIDIRNAVLYPVITSKKYKELSTTFQVSIPLLEIQDFNFLKAYFSKKLTLTRLELNAPRFQIYSKTGASKSLDLKKYKFPLPSFIQSLTLDELKINNGEVITYETDGINQFAHSNFTIDLTLPNVKMKNNKAKQAQIRTGNVLTKITHFKTPLGKSHDLEIGELNFNREQKIIDITGLRVN
ncbi:MAG: hypothetical protein J7L95_01610, partial [Prolixibacteraceae bacterium]|nr:hypothetical protein [Prolixibacteraceae bacterium]